VGKEIKKKKRKTDQCADKERGKTDLMDPPYLCEVGPLARLGHCGMFKKEGSMEEKEGKILPKTSMVAGMWRTWGKGSRNSREKRSDEKNQRSLNVQVHPREQPPHSAKIQEP